MISPPALRSMLVACLLWMVAMPVSASAPQAPAKVMLIGVFHFANPGRDTVKSRVIDVTTPENQRYLGGFATRLTAFQPMDVLMECSPTDQGAYDTQFKEYVAGRLQLKVDEIHQIGFRVARAAGLKGITCFDEDVIGWNAEPMFKYIEQHEPQRKQEMDAIFQSLSAQADKEQTTLSLPELLRLTNDPKRDASNKGLYLRTNDVDAGGGFSGADASASWWHRNFRMYANIQKAAAPGHRVIAVAGQGHTAILKDLLAVDSLRQSEDVVRYLQPTSAIAK